MNAPGVPAPLPDRPPTDAPSHPHPYPQPGASAGALDGATLPASARLGLDFDPDRLARDLDALSGTTWALQNTYSSDGTVASAAIDWRVLPLRNVGGDPRRTDPGGPGLVDFADTPWLGRAPYLAEVLAAVPAPLRAARLMALGPGALGPDHFDTKQGLAWGFARLHVPVSTTPEARLYLDGAQHHWQPGSFWYGDFSRTHRVENPGTGRRVHLVVDVMPTKELLGLFATSAGASIDPAKVPLARDPVPLSAREAARCAVTFELPESFADLEEPEGGFLRPQPSLAARIDVGDGATPSPVLTLDGEPTFGLVHVGDLEFRFTAWTEERTIQITGIGDGVRVVLRSRVQDRECRAELPAERV
ncbi:MAG: aspartyl/asparaginyl beta-hydroxylase domain-containing protein [Actinocrinis sp.]